MMQDQGRDDSFIVISLNEPRSPKGRYSLWTSEPDARRQIQSLLGDGVSACRIQVYRARPASSGTVPVAA